jgi:hypothetical protein
MVALDKAQRWATTAHTGEAPSPSSTWENRVSHSLRRVDRAGRSASGSVGNEVVGVDERQIAGIELNRPPAGRVGDAVPADLDGMSGQLTKILHDHP